jgi:hypothetical protein
VLWPIRLVVAFGAVVLFTPPAAAQDPSPSETAAARRLFHEGMRAARSENWEKARDAFERSYELVGRPRILANLATAQAQLGELVQAAESYRGFLRDTEDSGRRRARHRVKKELGKLEERIPEVTLQVQGLQSGDQLRLDGDDLSRAVVGTPLPLNPGEHHLAILREGESVAQNRFALEEGQSRTIALEAPRAVQRRASHIPVDGELEDDEGSSSAVRSPWLWSGVGAVVVGGAVAAALLLTQDDPMRQTGNFGPGRVTVE